MVVLLALVVLGAVGFATWRSSRVTAPTWASRASPRPRRSVGPGVFHAARLLGFRYSAPRDALVLRVGRGRYGPVLRLRDERRAARAAVAAPPASVASPPPDVAARAPDRPAPTPPPGPVTPAAARRIVDVAVLPLPPLPGAQDLWQLTAVDVEARFAWAAVTRATANGAPTPRAATSFVRRVARDLEAHGLQLDAIVVRPGASIRQPLFDGIVAGPIRLLRIAPGPRRGRIAARMHARVVAAYWRPALGGGGARRSLPTLRRGLRAWVEAHNDASGGSAAGHRSAPAEALRACAPRHPAS